MLQTTKVDPETREKSRAQLQIRIEHVVASETGDDPWKQNFHMIDLNTALVAIGYTALDRPEVEYIDKRVAEQIVQSLPEAQPKAKSRGRGKGQAVA